MNSEKRHDSELFEGGSSNPVWFTISQLTLDCTMATDTGRNESKVWDYFMRKEVVDDMHRTKQAVKCLIEECGKELPYGNRGRFSIAGMICHLYAKHKSVSKIDPGMFELTNKGHRPPDEMSVRVMRWHIKPILKVGEYFYRYHAFGAGGKCLVFHCERMDCKGRCRYSEELDTVTVYVEHFHQPHYNKTSDPCTSEVEPKNMEGSDVRPVTTFNQSKYYSLLTYFAKGKRNTSMCKVCKRRIIYKTSTATRHMSLFHTNLLDRIFKHNLSYNRDMSAPDLGEEKTQSEDMLRMLDGGVDESNQPTTSNIDENSMDHQPQLSTMELLRADMGIVEQAKPMDYNIGTNHENFGILKEEHVDGGDQNKGVNDQYQDVDDQDEGVCAENIMDASTENNGRELATAEWSKRNIRLLMLHEFKMGSSVKLALENINKTVRPQNVERRMVAYWFGRFASGNMKLGAVDEEDLRDLVGADPTQSVLQMAEKLGVTKTAVSVLIHDMGMVRKSGRWIQDNSKGALQLPHVACSEGELSQKTSSRSVTSEMSQDSSPPCLDSMMADDGEGGSNVGEAGNNIDAGIETGGEEGNKIGEGSSFKDITLEEFESSLVQRLSAQPWERRAEARNRVEKEFDTLFAKKISSEINAHFDSNLRAEIMNKLLNVVDHC